MNGGSVTPTYRIQNSDLIVYVFGLPSNKVHRHEPAVTDAPVRILHRDDQQGRLVVVKPGSIPVHATGRYHRHTLVEMVKEQTGLDQVFTSNRLDRLTSGIMVCSTTKEAAAQLGNDFNAGLVNKAYVCRVVGQFPPDTIDCREPILAVDRQSGLNIVHPKGKDCRTLFQLLSYDPKTDTSVVMCRPITGRTHQIRVHAQWLGHPISNDPLYNHPVWASVDRDVLSTAQPRHYERVGGESGNVEVERVLAALKGARDDSEGWARWRDDVLFGTINRQMQYETVDVPGPNGQPAPAPPADTAPMDTEVCEVCRIPLLPDPTPDELYIYLHAIKYWTDAWSFEDELPWWATETWQDAHATSDRRLPDWPLLSHHQGVDVGKGGAHRRIDGALTMPSTIVERPARPCDAGTQVAPALLLDVPRGLEDVAQRELLARVAIEAPVALESALHSGVVRVDASRVAGDLVHLYRAAQLPSVLAAYYDMGRHILPQPLLDALFAERAETLGAGHAGHEVNAQPTSSEEALLAYLTEAWACDDMIRAEVLAAYDIGTDRTFAVAVDRSSYVFPTLSTSALEEHLATLVRAWLTSVRPGAWERVRKGAQVLVKMSFSPRFGVDESLQSGPRSRQGNPGGSLLFQLHVTPGAPGTPEETRATIARARGCAIAGLLPLTDDEAANADVRVSTLQSADHALADALLDELHVHGVRAVLDEAPADGTLQGAVVELPEKAREVPHATLFPLAVERMTTVLHALAPYTYAVVLTSEPRMLSRALREVENQCRRDGAPFSLRLAPFTWTRASTCAHAPTINDGLREAELRGGMRSFFYHRTYVALVGKAPLFGA